MFSPFGKTIDLNVFILSHIICNSDQSFSFSRDILLYFSTRSLLENKEAEVRILL